ncbi:MULTISPECIES: hypothetical protein [Xanthomonas]|uniref:Uncharacterized protein n=1 Tax=Xanthomonas cucurbitae TaxID=56453 RepID=A0A2S7DN65_9XANT|nr:hypothetical protein [Xanthomonas cucurbitae]PPU75265.1 hypothetical protein XcuCFBP2542_15010 [Xanthomonas cucurbitae]QHG87615.1 hypothetical protein EBN15_12365 [Xanthomonas cucurbitae]WDM66474.1 hypothetical protein K6981_13060 [Xanthomonas cucurbitae]WDM70353.1 hypothetical protein K6978_13030 [Xanthomonas cucurbitae]WDM74227.1 hypothetical protein K6982_12390 [Xanthomonas cucurbitae]
MATRTLADSLFIDPVSVDSVFVDPVIDAGAHVHCAAATAPPTCITEDERLRQQHLQQALAVQSPQSQPGLRPEWVQARAALLAAGHRQGDATIAPEPLGSSPRNHLH